jgi:hypothetical protein
VGLPVCASSAVIVTTLAVTAPNVEDGSRSCSTPKSASAFARSASPAAANGRAANVTAYRDGAGCSGSGSTICL